MAIQAKTGIKCEYRCNVCNIDYSEQRNPGEPQFFVNCQNFQCTGVYELLSETEFTYEQEVYEPVIDAQEVTPTPALEG